MSKLGDKHWTKTQVFTLQADYATVDTETIAQRLGKTTEATRVKANRMGLHKAIEIMPEGMKRCPRCGKVAALNVDFWPGQSYCKKCVVARAAEWARQNKEHLAAYYYTRKARDPLRMYITAARATHKQRSEDKAGHDLTVNEWLHAIEVHKNTCPLCGKPFTKEDPAELDCIVPISQGGHLTAANVQPLHAFCNNSKGAKLLCKK